MIDSQILGNHNLDYYGFLETLSQFYSAVEREKNCLTTPSLCTSPRRKSFSIKFSILRLYPLFEKLARYRSKFPELSLHEIILAWQTVFWMAEHHQLDTIFKYFFDAYENLKEFYESFNK